MKASISARAIGGLLLAGLMLAPSVSTAAESDGLTGARLEIALADGEGRVVSLADPRYRGKVVVLTLGGAWCVSCHVEARFLVPWAAKRARDDLAVIGLHFEYPDDPKAARALIDGFARRYRIPWPLLLAGKPTSRSVAAALGGRGAVKSLPTTILIGRDGRVRDVHSGWDEKGADSVPAAAQAAFEAKVDRLLAEPAPPG
jgi:peroxiredoxin